MPRRAFVPEQLHHAPFTRAQAEAAGVSRTSLQKGPWRRMFFNVWAHIDLPDTRENRLAAARLAIPPRGVLHGVTAAWTYGADVRRQDDLDVHVGFPPGRRTRPQQGLVVCQETLRPEDICTISGMAVTSPVRTTFDCMRLLRGNERLVVADAMTHLELTDVGELRAYFARQRRLRNLRIAELLIDDIEPKSESPMETRLRLLLVGAGLPRPEAQHEIRNAEGVLMWRLDLAYVQERIAIEYDGAWHWKQRRHDERRWAALRARDWDVRTFDSDDVYGNPDSVVREIAAALRARRARTAS